MHKRFSGALAIAGLTAAILTTTASASPSGEAPDRRERPAMSEEVSFGTPAVGDGSSAGRAAVDDQAQVELRGDNAALRDAIAEAGGAVIGESDGLVRATLPESQTDGLADRPGVDYVGSAPRLHPFEELSEGIAETGADAWHTASTDGTGVDVAIVDLGFAGWDALPVGELPASVATSFGSCLPGEAENTEHGTAVAEIVHDMAPGAALHLICVDDTTDLYPGSPVHDYLLDNDIEVANASFGAFLDSRGDGMSAADRGINQSRIDGTLWVVSSGNAGDSHVRIPKNAPIKQQSVAGEPGSYIDLVDANTSATVDPFIRFVVPAGGGVFIEARWDAFPSTRIDYDLYAFTTAAVSEAGFVNGSINDQAGVPGVPPVEGFGFLNDSGSAQDFYLVVNAFSTGSRAPIDIFFHGTSSVEYATAAGSVAEPGTSPGALTVGAACYADGTLEPFSSQGPTTDGRVKPDLVAPDATSGVTYGPADACDQGGFFGTSAAAPHVTGAAALVLDAQPTLGPTDVQSILERRATAAGPAGKDNAWGWGQLDLGAADAPVAPTGNAFTGLSPSQRVVDTRVTSNPLTGGSTRQITIAGTLGVPADATAVVLSVVAVKPTASAYLTAYPSGAARPVASSLNFSAGSVTSNSVTVGLGPDGAISLFNYSGTTHVVIDLAGWYGPTATEGLQSLAPIRAIDTRPGKSTRIAVPGGDIGGPEILRARLAGNAAIPEVPPTASAVVLNVAVTGPTATGHLTAWPTGLPKPLASNLNFAKGATVANLVIAKVSAGGEVDVAVNTGKAHVIVDVLGYFDAAASGRFVALPTVNRMLDTRTGTGGGLGTVVDNDTQPAQIAELYGVPGDAVGVVLNVTVVGPEAATGHLRVWGTGPLPTASTLNFTRGAIVGNAAMVGLGPSAQLVDGWLGFYNSSADDVHVVADVAGYFVNAAP